MNLGVDVGRDAISRGRRPGGDPGEARDPANRGRVQPDDIDRFLVQQRLERRWAGDLVAGAYRGGDRRLQPAGLADEVRWKWILDPGEPGRSPPLRDVDRCLDVTPGPDNVNHQRHAGA